LDLTIKSPLVVSSLS